MNSDRQGASLDNDLNLYSSENVYGLNFEWRAQHRPNSELVSQRKLSKADMKGTKSSFIEMISDQSPNRTSKLSKSKFYPYVFLSYD